MDIPLGTVNLCGLNRAAYLAYVPERIAEHPVNRIVELLSWSVTL